VGHPPPRERPQAVQRGVGGVDDRVHPLEQVVVVVLHDRDEQPGLGAEVEGDRRLRYPGVSGDPCAGGPLEPLGGEAVTCGGDDGRAGSVAPGARVRPPADG
jgi:hypothetical protein